MTNDETVAEMCQLFAIATAITIIIGKTRSKLLIRPLADRLGLGACVGELGQHQKQVYDSHGQLVHDKGLEHYEKVGDQYFKSSVTQYADSRSANWLRRSCPS